MSVAQKWLSGMLGLGALYLVVVNPNGFYRVSSGVKNLTAGGITEVVTGGRRG